MSNRLIKSSVSLNLLHFTKNYILIIKLSIKNIYFLFICVNKLLSLMRRSWSSNRSSFLNSSVPKLRVFWRVSLRNFSNFLYNSLSINSCCYWLIPYELVAKNVLIFKFQFSLFFSLKKHQLNIFVNCKRVDFVLLCLFIQLISILNRNLTKLRQFCQYLRPRFLKRRRVERSLASQGSIWSEHH